eukprot:3926992-Prymnesium_polylepis.1
MEPEEPGQPRSLHASQHRGRSDGEYMGMPADSDSAPPPGQARDTHTPAAKYSAYLRRRAVSFLHSTPAGGARQLSNSYVAPPGATSTWCGGWCVR